MLAMNEGRNYLTSRLWETLGHTRGCQCPLGMMGDEQGFKESRRGTYSPILAIKGNQEEGDGCHLQQLKEY